MGQVSCKGCVHFEGKTFECRRYPPVIHHQQVVDSGDGVTSKAYCKFPEVSPEWKCGEFKKKPVKKK